MVAHASALAEPGSWVLEESLGRSLIVARGPAGGLHVSVNACSHRGTRLVRGAGRGRVRCPYHGWVFCPSGRLLGAFRRAGLAPCEDSELALVPWEVRELGPLLFAAPRALPWPASWEALGAGLPAERGVCVGWEEPQGWQELAARVVGGEALGPNAWLQRARGRLYRLLPAAAGTRVEAWSLGPGGGRQMTRALRAGWSELATAGG